MCNAQKVISSFESGYVCAGAFFPIISLDNLDKSLTQGSNYSGRSTNCIHLTLSSLHAMYLPNSPSIDHAALVTLNYKNIKNLYSTREEFLHSFIAPADRPDFVAYQEVLLGQVWKHRHQLSSAESHRQVSTWYKMLSSMEAQHQQISS